MHHHEEMRSYSSLDENDLIRAEQDVAARVGGLDVDFGAMAVVSNVYRVANLVRGHMERTVLARDNLSWTAFVVLFVLWVWGTQESRHLAEECGVSKGTLTGVVGTLEGRGLIERSPHPTDGRLRLIRLTAAGRRLMRRLYPRFNAAEVEITAALNDSEQTALAHQLRMMVRTLDADAGGAPSR